MNVEEFFSKYNELRRSGPLLTNSTLTRQTLELLLQNDRNERISGSGFLALLAPEEDLSRLYFFVRDGETLNSIRSFLDRRNETVVADVVGRGESTARLLEMMKRSGFRFGDRFVRMMCTEPISPACVNEISVTYPDVSEAGVLRAMLKKEFDPLFAHLPPEEELCAALRKKEITVIRSDGQIAAWTFFETVAARQKCLRYFLTDEAFRGRGYAAALLSHEFGGYSPGMRYSLWLSVRNRTIDLYRKIGFALDGLTDDIMIYRKWDNG